MKLDMNFGKISTPIAQDNNRFKVAVVGAKSFGNIFDGALSLEIGDGSKVSANKTSATLEPGHCAFT